MWKGTVLLMLAAAAGCSTVGGSGGNGTSLTDKAWQLQELGGQPMRSAGADAPSLQFDPARGVVQGSGGCNSFTGRYEWTGRSLRLGPLASTRRACLDQQAGQQESAFFQALEQTRTWQVSGKTLVLSGEQGQTARFTAR